MEIKYSENVKLTVNVTPKMLQDFRECREMAKIIGRGGKDCNTCSMNVILCEEDDTALCQLNEVFERMIEMAGELDGK